MQQNKFVNFLKSFTPYQIIYLCSVLIITALFTIFLPDEMLEDTSNTFVVVCSVIAVISNPICELLISKQSKWNFIVSVVFVELTEFVVLISTGLYALSAVTLLFWIPIDIASFVRWHRHPDEEKEELTVVKKLSAKADVLIVIAVIVVSLVGGYFLNMIPDEAEVPDGEVSVVETEKESSLDDFISYLDAFVAACGMVNGVLLLLRYTEQWYAWLITLIGDAVVYSVTGSYIMLITVAAMLVNTCYGFVKWLIYTRRHKNAV